MRTRYPIGPPGFATRLVGPAGHPAGDREPLAIPAPGANAKRIPTSFSPRTEGRPLEILIIRTIFTCENYRTAIIEGRHETGAAGGRSEVILERPGGRTRGSRPTRGRGNRLPGWSAALRRSLVSARRRASAGVAARPQARWRAATRSRAVSRSQSRNAVKSNRSAVRQARSRRYSPSTITSGVPGRDHDRPRLGVTAPRGRTTGTSHNRSRAGGAGRARRASGSNVSGAPRRANCRQ